MVGSAVPVGFRLTAEAVSEVRESTGGKGGQTRAGHRQGFLRLLAISPLHADDAGVMLWVRGVEGRVDDSLLNPSASA
jgi:hypothetical protein